MAEVIEGSFLGAGLRIGVVTSRFNEWVTEAMLEGALNELRRLGVSDADIKVVWVPGAYEIPFACQSLCEAEKIDVLVALGCIIRGETTHYEHVAQSTANGIMNIALQYKMPLGFGVITVENMAQAMERSGGKQGNKGRDAARSAVEMYHVSVALKSKGGGFKDLIKQEIKHDLSR